MTAQAQYIDMPAREDAVDAAGAWEALRLAAERAAGAEPTLASYLHAAVLGHDTMCEAMAYVMGQKLGGDSMNPMQTRGVFAAAYNADPELLDAAKADMVAVHARDPACQTLLQPFLYFKGFHALQAHRVAHHLWRGGRDLLALHIQGRVSDRFGVDVHPAARIGRGVMIDHATSVVIGETAVVGDDCSLLHEVTLGGTGVVGGDRHPKVGRGVMIGAGAKVLGNITIGDEAKIAAGSVVLKPVPARCIVAGVPAKPVGGECAQSPAAVMDQTIDDVD